LFAVIFNAGTSFAKREFVLADFDSGTKPNNVDGDFGAWDKDPNDDAQSCELDFTEDDALGDQWGGSIKLIYDVDSPKTAYNGLWMHLSGTDASDYTTLNMYVRGDKEAGYPKSLKIEVKDGRRNKGSFVIKGITDKWKKFVIPFNRFRGVKSWSNISEFVVVFEGAETKPRQGIVYIDHIYLTNVFDLD